MSKANTADPKQAKLLRRIGRVAVAGLALLVAPVVRAQTRVEGTKSETPMHSELWGENGEKWDRRRLPDFSNAGYRQGEAAIPQWPVKVNAADFGASGADDADDTAAIQRAIDACPPEGAVLLPVGRYVITDFLHVTKNQIVLRGAGKEATTLYFPKGLEEIHSSPAVANHGASTTNWSWSGGFISFENAEDVGVENLTLSFPEVPYPGHFNEKGANGVNFMQCDNGWVRGVNFRNCDSGVFVVQSTHVTLENLMFSQFAARGKVGGHHGVDFQKSSRCLGTSIRFENKFFHELGVEHGSNYNVYAACQGPDLALDHHQPDVHHTLWTDIDVGAGKSIWANNSRAARLNGNPNPSAASGSTSNDVYWNIHSGLPIVYPEKELNNIVVGITSSGTPRLDADPSPTGYWHETLPPGEIMPTNLYEAQLRLRLNHLTPGISRTKSQETK